MSISVTTGDYGFQEVHVYPPEVPIEKATKRKPDGEPNEYWVAGFMALSDHCCC